MQNTMLPALLTIPLTAISQITKAQIVAKDTLASDTSIYDDTRRSHGHDGQPVRCRISQPFTFVYS